MKNILVPIILAFFCLSSLLNAECIDKNKAEKMILKKVNKEYDSAEMIGKVEEYASLGKGVPDFACFFKANKSPNIVEIVFVGVDICGGKVGMYPMKYYAETEKFIIQFFDSLFVSMEVEKRTGQKVGALQLSYCPRQFFDLACLCLHYPFWRVYLINGDEYFFYFVSERGWTLMNAAETRSRMFHEWNK
jgi:hypothetical protein